jgi:hypothetical protein
MTLGSIVRKAHRIFALLFLLTIPPAAYFSLTGDPNTPSPFVYLPLFPLLFLTLGGIYLLVSPWIRTLRARRAGAPPS